MGRRKKYTGVGVDTVHMTAICERCGGLMERIDEDTFTCSNCGCSYEYDDKFFGWNFYDPSEYGWQAENVNRPQICTGCGSDMYPDCQYSCKLMNN